MFSVMKNDNQDSIWVKLKKESSGEENDIYIGTYYISPLKGKEGIDKSEKLWEEVLFFQKSGYVMINGDFNAKTGNEDDFITPDKYNDNMCTHYTESFHKRNSQDKALDERGKNIIDMCKGLDLSIINGRKSGDIFGNFTSFQWNGNSVVDYLITSEQLFKKIIIFKVGEFRPWLSDHCPINFKLELNKTKQTISADNNMSDGPKQFTWSDKGKNDFLYHLKNPDTIHQIDNITNFYTHDPNTMISALTEILIHTAKEAKVKTVKIKDKNVKNPPWFDYPCVKLKNEIKCLGNKIKRDPHNLELRLQLSKAKKISKKISAEK